MKKILLFVFLFVYAIMPSFALGTTEIISSQEYAKTVKRINEVGFRLLNSNGIEKRTVFTFDNSYKTINANSNSRNRIITLYRGLYVLLESDDELAAVLGHEISHSIDSYDGKMKGYFEWFRHIYAPRKYERKADKRAVDYMVNAGYNPVAMIVVMSKCFSQTRYEWYSSHPLSSRRMMYVYEYIYTKYPEYLVNNTYKDNIYYQNFLITSRENRLKFQKKVQTKSNCKVKYY